ncbi:MAG TPA: pyruvate kinase [Nitrospira sp.]|jgi:pyruvate kinase|nr:pyruvate kinase [Nitrospira sp.]
MNPHGQVGGEQKRIIFEANRRGRRVINAAQMLKSITQALRSTRAEASDVANASSTALTP